MNTKKPINIDVYIKGFSSDIQKILQMVRRVIKKAAPGAEEVMSYGMPTFKLFGKNLVHFAAWKEHLGFYPIPSGIKAFKKELEPYQGAKGSVKFPYNKIPYGLITKIVKFRVRENKEYKK